MSEPNDQGVPQWSQAGPPPPPAKQKGRWVSWAIIGAVAVGVAIAVGAGMGGSDSDDEDAPAEKSTYLDTPADNRDWAILACQDAVTNQLKDPESATFSGETAVRRTGTQDYDVTGFVNARNSFGGMVGDKAYTCTASLNTARTTMNSTATIAE